MYDILLALLFGIFGAAVGSFLNVVIYRVPRKESIAFPASHCTSCGAAIKPYDNIPVISYLVLGGKCRACGATYSWRYPAVELLTGVLWALAFAKFGLTAALPAALFFTAVLVAVSFIDLEHHIIPNKIVLPAIVVGLALILLQGVRPFMFGAIGLLVGGGLLFLIAMLYPKGMGGGDVKLAALMGVILNFYVLMALFGAFLLGAVGGLLLIASGIKGRKDFVPFGPFLAIGSLIALFLGPEIWSAYRLLIGLGPG